MATSLTLRIERLEALHAGQHVRRNAPVLEIMFVEPVTMRETDGYLIDSTRPGKLLRLPVSFRQAHRK
jgi:hypothetical protein